MINRHSKASIFVQGFLCASLAVAAATAVHAEAPNGSGDFKIAFFYDNAELATPEGASELLARMEREVRKECTDNRVRGTGQSRLVRECVDATMKEAVGKIGSATLAGAYETRRAG